MTVAAAQDADAVNDAASITHAVVASRSADEFDAVNIAGVAVTVTDDETAGVTVSETTLTVDEGGSGNLHGEVLDAQPTSDVVISVTRTGSSDVTLDTDTGTSGNQTTLTFTTANWSTAQTVTVAAAQDADAVNDAAAISHAVDASRSANEFDAVTIGGVAVTVTDDDTAGVTVSETTLTVAEGGSATYTVVLNLQPTSDVVINVTKSGSSDVTVSPATLTFTTANWSTAQTVTVAAAQDADAVDDAAVHRPRRRRRPERRRVRRREHRRGGGDRHRRRYRRGDGVRNRADGGRGRQRNLHGGPGRAAHLQRGDQRHQDRQYRRDAGHRHGDVRQPDHADLHPGQLEHGADGDGGCRPGRRRGERRGRPSPTPSTPPAAPTSTTT